MVVVVLAPTGTEAPVTTTTVPATTSTTPAVSTSTTSTVAAATTTLGEPVTATLSLSASTVASNGGLPPTLSWSVTGPGTIRWRWRSPAS